MKKSVKYVNIRGPEMHTWAVNSLLEMESEPIKYLFNLN